MTTSLIEKLLAAIDETEQLARDAAGHRGTGCIWNALVLRRCAADRKVIDLYREIIGDRDLSGYGQFGSLKDDPAALAVTLSVEALVDLAEGYGIAP